VSANTDQTFEDENVNAEEYSFSIDNSNENTDFSLPLQALFSFPTQVWAHSYLRAPQKVLSHHYNTNLIRAPPILRL